MVGVMRFPTTVFHAGKHYNFVGVVEFGKWPVGTKVREKDPYNTGERRTGKVVSSKTGAMVVVWDDGDEDLVEDADAAATMVKMEEAPQLGFAGMALYAGARVPYRGEDYDVSQSSMAQQVRNAALVHADGKTVRVEETAGTVRPKPHPPLDCTCHGFERLHQRGAPSCVHNVRGKS